MSEIIKYSRDDILFLVRELDEQLGQHEFIDNITDLVRFTTLIAIGEAICVGVNEKQPKKDSKKKAHLKQQILKLEGVINDLTINLESTESSRDKLFTENTKLINALQLSNQRRDDVLKESSSKSAVISNQKQDIERLQWDNQEKTNELILANTCNIELKKENSNLTCVCQQITNELEVAKQQIESLSKQNETDEKIIRSLREEIKNLENRPDPTSSLFGRV